QSPSISLSKTADPLTYSAVGEVVTYTFTVENTGNVTLSDVSISDPLTGLSAVSPANIATLAPGATETFTATYTITQADLDNGSVTNTATVNAIDPNGNAIIGSDSEVINAEFNLLIANDDTAGPINGLTGGEAGINVLDNDTLNGNPVDTADVTITPNTEGPLTVNADGTVTVSPNTPAGTYTVEYTICENLNAANCATGTITVEVSAAVLVANGDTAGPINGLTGGDAGINVLDNDTLNGNPVDPSAVTITPNTEGPLTVNVDGTVTVSPNTPAGTYTVAYTVCENLNPANCSTATVTVEIAAGDLIANDIDFGSFTTDFEGLLGNALANDLLNGQPLDPNLVDFEIIDFDGLEGVFVNPNGELAILPFFNTPGNYVLTYRICKILNPDNCSTANIFIQIEESRVDLIVTKSSQEIQIFEGDEFDYIIELFNNSDVTAFNVVLTDDLPSGVTFMSTTVIDNPDGLDVNVRIGSGEVIYEIPVMPGRAILNIRLRVRANPLSGQEELTLRNVVSVLSDQIEMVPENNFDEDINTVNAFFIPNVITPNNDGKNDVFIIRGINKFVSNKIVIFNRWGDHVFEAQNYQNNWNAEGLIDGTYFYVFTATDSEGREHQFKGWIHVTRRIFD
ncbi:MAG: DUF7507 domain-containing protein, partial [Cecembia sp.]